VLSLNSIAFVVGATASERRVVAKNTAALAESLGIFLVCFAEENLVLCFNSLALVIRAASVDIAVDAALLSERRGLEMNWRLESFL